MNRPPWGMVAVLVAASILSFVDRQILSMLVEPIKRDLRINDFQFGLLGGPAFAIFYALAGLPLGWLADRMHRGYLIGTGIFFWSLMTGLSAFAANFGQLFVMRMGVGIGEAALGPAAQSLIADRFDARRLPLAMSIYAAGVVIGAGLAFALGGQAVALGEAARSLPGLGGLAGWQAAFVIVAVPGPLIALLVVLVVRDTGGRQSRSQTDTTGLRAFWRANRRLILLYSTGISLLTASSYASLLWLPAVFIRRFGWTPAEFGLVFGAMLIVLAIAGTLSAGSIAGRWVASGRRDAPVVLTAIAALVAVPTSLAGAMPNAWLAIALLVPGLFVSSIYAGLGPTIVQSVAPAAIRSQVAAIALMVTNLFGMVTGPVAVGALTSYAFGDPLAVGYSLAITTMALTGIAGAALLAMRGDYLRALDSRSAP